MSLPRGIVTFRVLYSSTVSGHVFGAPSAHRFRSVLENVCLRVVGKRFASLRQYVGSKQQEAMLEDVKIIYLSEDTKPFWEADNAY